MKFVALLSGGKDSCFNIIKCTENKHELVALANLMPQQSDVEEINSFMYQSAAHNTIPFMAECFGVPLYRQEILGRAVVQSLDYDRNGADEVEDLFRLLQRVVDMHPDIEGVSCGAIVSNYQRLRVEDVCSRLNLTPLTYLWMRDREDLLDEIICSGVVAVLVKVAGAGLDPHKHLGKDLAEMRPILHRLHERFGLDFCGEGGEYESLVLDCNIFKKRLVLLETAVLLDEEDCSVGNLKILQCGVVDKAPPGVLSGVPYENLSVNSEIHHGYQLAEQLLKEDNQLVTSIREIIRLTSISSRYSCKKQSASDETKDQVKNRIDYKYENISSEQFYNSFTVSLQQSHGVTKRAEKKRNVTNRRFQCLFGKDGIGQTSLRCNLPVLISNINLKDSSTASAISSMKDPREEEAVRQMRAIMLQLKEMIESSIDCDLKDICFIHLYLSDISLFPTINSEYCKWFGRNPPSRSCVAVLHVRGISDWAPLCIGPYAQGNVLTDSLVYVAGQIPLNPSSMSCIEDDNIVGINQVNGQEEFRNIEVKSESMDSVMAKLMDSLSVQLVLSLRHAARILGPLNSSLNRCLGCTVYLNMDMLEKKYGLRLKDLISGNIRNTCSSSDSNLSNSSSDCNSKHTAGESDMNVCHSRDKESIFSQWSGWGILSDLTQRLLNNNCMETIPGVVTTKRVNADGDSDSDIDSDEENMEIEGDRTDSGSMAGASKNRDGSRNDVLLPVLVVGVRGIPRDCLLEIEVTSLTDLLPLGGFISSVSNYQMQLSPHTSSIRLKSGLYNDSCDSKDINSFDSTASAEILEVGGEKDGSTSCPSDIQCQLGIGSGTGSGSGTGLSVDQLDDLDPDFWPVWYRVQENTPKGKKVDESVTDSRTAVAADGVTDLGSHIKSKQQKTELPCDIYTILRSKVHASASSGRGDILNDHLCTDRNCDIPSTVEALQRVLVSTIRATECNRCVCSGFGNVYLRESRMDQKNVLKELSEERPLESDLVERIDVESGVGDGTKADQDSGERCLMNEDIKSGGVESTVQQAANLLFLSVHQQMVSAALNIPDLRTFRVYYQPSNISLNKRHPGEEEVMIKSENSNAEEKEEEGVINMQNVGPKILFKNDEKCCESAVEEACLSAIESVFGVPSDTFPLLLIPVTQLAAVEPCIEKSSKHTKATSTPLLSAQFLFISLIQIKSETWIRGH